MTKLKEAQQYLHSLANPVKIPDYKRFFKTGKGGYGEGDQFLGVKVPDIRKVVKDYRFILTYEEIEQLLYSQHHEERMLALLILVARYKSKKLNLSDKQKIYNFYISHISQINNWDLIDVTCPHIIGVHLLDKDRTILYDFAASNELWEKRISIVSTFAFINSHQYQDTLSIADILLKDEHDLIHKAVGWAIRNVGIKDLQTEIEFLNSRYKNMPRTMLRYAIEKFDEPLRQHYLKGQV